MVRIIPWKLPEVKGGSIGGYTEHGSGSGGDTPVITEYFDFENAVLKSQVNTQSVVDNRVHFWTTANSTAIYKAINYTYSGNGLPYKGWLEGIDVITLLGVASVSVVIKGTSNDATLGDVTIKASYDLETGALTFIEGQTTGALSSNNSYFAAVSQITFTVYNGSGEVIQQTEVDYS